MVSNTGSETFNGSLPTAAAETAGRMVCPAIDGVSVGEARTGGTGRAVEGPSISLSLAVPGHSSALAVLAGPGVQVLGERC